MLQKTVFRGIPLLLAIGIISSIGVDADNSFCSWRYRDIICTKDQFQCINNKCIARTWYCDNANDCGDNSDEQYCSVSKCPSPLFIACAGSRKCIPVEWICNGHKDCPSGDDEIKCERSPYTKGLRRIYYSASKISSWLHSQRLQRATEKWGSQVDKSAVIFYFTDIIGGILTINDNDTFAIRNETIKEMAYEASIQLLHRLAHMKLEDVPSNDLASYVNAFLILCLNPRNFHGFDLIQELESRIKKQNYTNPYVLLALCNAGYSITEYDKMKLMDTFNNKRRPMWTGMRSLVIMALACAGKSQGNKVNRKALQTMSQEMVQSQHRNGSVENLQTTALVMQALLSTRLDKDPDHFDEIKALQQILKNEVNGSFGDLMNTYYVTPIFICKSLIDINSDHCDYLDYDTDEDTAVENLAIIRGPKKRVQYSLWIGINRDLERNLVLRVPVNMSMYGIMEIAAEVDSRYRFEYTVQNRIPYINGLSGIRDNPEKGKFWFLFSVEDGQPSPSSDSPADVVPKDNDHYVMWYRSGSWVE